VYKLGLPLEPEMTRDGEVGPDYPPNAMPLG